MKILRELEWNGIEIADNIRKYETDDILDLVEELPERNVILLRDQDLSKADLANIFNQIGRSRSPGQWFNDDEHPEIINVTNKRSDVGSKTGLFADLELGWHCNGIPRPKPLEVSFALYCNKPGIDSVTSFVNTRKAYYDLPSDVKDLVDTIDCAINFHAFTGELKTIGSNDGGYKLTADDPEYAVFAGKIKGEFQSVPSHNPEGLTKPLVASHPWDEKRSLYFVNNFITDWWSRTGKEFDGAELWEFLNNHLFQEKYIYHHHWKSGDLLFNDQWNAFHRRNAVKGDRELYRLCADNFYLLERMISRKQLIPNADRKKVGLTGGTLCTPEEFDIVMRKQNEL